MSNRKVELPRIYLLIAGLAAAALAPSSCLAEGASRTQLDGKYHPGGYYSQSYLQTAPTGAPVGRYEAKLLPYQRYGRHRLGQAFPPLATGSVLSERFPYRYDLDFEPPASPSRYAPDPCDPEVRLRHSKTYPSPTIAPVPPPHPLGMAPR